MGGQGEDTTLVYTHTALTSMVPNQGRQRAPGAHQCSDHVGTDAWHQVTHFRKDLDSKHDLGQLGPRVGDLTSRSRKSRGGFKAV